MGSAREREGEVALLAETWLVMNNPICLPLRPALPVLHRHTQHSVSQIPLQTASREGGGVQGKDKEWRARGEDAGCVPGRRYALTGYANRM